VRSAERGGAGATTGSGQPNYTVRSAERGGATTPEFNQRSDHETHEEFETQTKYARIVDDEPSGRAAVTAERTRGRDSSALGGAESSGVHSGPGARGAEPTVIGTVSAREDDKKECKIGDGAYSIGLVLDNICTFDTLDCPTSIQQLLDDLYPAQRNVSSTDRLLTSNSTKQDEAGPTGGGVQSEESMDET